MLSDKLYSIESRGDSVGIVKLSDAQHPVFKAHFPSQAILPGFMHFEIVSQLFDLEITTIKKAKFLKPALPEQILTYKRDKNKFIVLCEEEEIASFSL